MMLGSYDLSIYLFQRALAFVYLIAFLNVVNQYIPLLGKNGLLPVRLFLKQVDFKQAPSIFWINCSDTWLLLFGWIGVTLSTLALIGVDGHNFILSFSIWGVLWLLYLSYVNVGQTWYSFGWETLLLEAGFLAIFLGPMHVEKSLLLTWLIRWIAFRVMFGAGLIKIRADRCWRDLSCLDYHYQTQPIPNPVSWYLHKFPKWFHRLSVLYNHFIELIVPFGLLAPPPISSWAAILTIGFQVILIISGNLSFLNYITIVVCIPAIDDAFIQKFVSWQISTDPIGGIYEIIIYLITGLICLLSIRPFLNLISPYQAMNTSYDALHLVNSYGAFGNITKQRFEIIIEGMEDSNPLEEAVWKEYEFKAKPGNVSSCPPIISPYHLRLDWLMWFAAMGHYQSYPWILNLIAKLLQDDKKVIGLLAKNPFPEKPPNYIRANLYKYEFTSFKEKDWWKRVYVEEYLPPLSLDHPQFREILMRRGWLHY